MPLTVASGTTRAIESGSVVYAQQVGLAGEINLTGELTTGDASASASGTGDGTGTATATPQRLASGTGVGEAIAQQTEFDRLLIESGTTDSVSSGDVLDTGTLDLAGEINVAGELQVEEAKPVALWGSFKSASGIGEGFGTADALPRRFVSASGEGEGFGTAAFVISIPLVRGDTPDIEWHEDEDIDLGADSDGTT